MPSRWIQVALFGLAAAMLIAAAFSKRWLVTDQEMAGLRATLRIGLTGLQVCANDGIRAGCQSVAWSELPGVTDGSTWMWLGRLTFVLSIASALALIALGGLEVMDVELRAPVSLPRIAVWMCLVIVPLAAGYWLLPPHGLSSLETGRGFYLGLLGAFTGAFASWRKLRVDDFS